MDRTTLLGYEYVGHIENEAFLVNLLGWRML